MDMLAAEENQLLTRVGPGTPGGDLLRRFWLPVLLAAELPAPDCAPVRLKILGESLVAFRDTAGRIATVVMYFEVMGAPVYIPYRVTDITVQYSNVREKMDLMNQLAPDPYEAQKALYLTLHELSCGGQALAYREFFTK